MRSYVGLIHTPASIQFSSQRTAANWFDQRGEERKRWVGMQKNLMNETQCDVNRDRLTHKSRVSGRRGYKRPQQLSVVLETANQGAKSRERNERIHQQTTTVTTINTGKQPPNKKSEFCAWQQGCWQICDVKSRGGWNSPAAPTASKWQLIKHYFLFCSKSKYE